MCGRCDDPRQLRRRAPVRRDLDRRQLQQLVHLRQTIPQLLNLGLSGFGMSGADVGGFASTPSAELLTRWIEVGAFQPIDRDHTATGTGQQEPWENGTPEDLNLRRRYIEERYRLLPYLYTTVEEMSRTGLPVMRPMFLEFPEEASGRQIVDPAVDNNFMLGSALLVAESPYPDEMDNFAVALPPVGWYNYWTGARAEGMTGRRAIDNTAIQQSEARIQRSLDTLPVFVSRRRDYSGAAASAEHGREAGGSAHGASLSSNRVQQRL